MSVIVEGLFCVSAQQFLLGLQLKELSFLKPSAMGTSSADWSSERDSVERSLCLDNSPARFLRIDLGGWDAPSNQGAANSGHRGRLANFAQEFQML